MRTMFAASLLALAPLGVPSLQQTPPATAPATAPPARPASPMDAPKLPPFAGEIVNFDRRGSRVVACVDASKVAAPPRMGPDGKPVAPAAPPPGPPEAPRLRIWVLEHEVMQELMTTGGLCDPAWSPDGKTFAAAGVRGVFTFTEPNFDPRVLVAGQLQAPAPGAPPAREYDDPTWSPSGGRIAFRSTAAGVSRVEVVDVKSAEVLLKRDGPAKGLRWADERTLVVDATRVPVP
jgi:dipeptidyl aminopeptidase/acylaminoacyl peptidase